MSDVIKFVNQLVDETSPPEDAPRLEMQEGGRPVDIARRRIPYTEETFKKIDQLLKDPKIKTYADLGRALGLNIPKPTGVRGRKGPGTELSKRSGLIKAYEASRGQIPADRFKLGTAYARGQKKVEDVLKLQSEGMSTNAIAQKLKMDRRNVRTIFERFRPEAIKPPTPKVDDPTTTIKTRASRKRQKREAAAYKKAGEKTARQTKGLIDKIKSTNDDILKMSDAEILADKNLRYAMSIDATGLKRNEPIKFDKYKNLSDKDYVAKVRDKARKKTLFTAEHISEVAKEKLNTAFPNNIVNAPGRMGSQVQAMKEYLRKNPDGEFAAQIDDVLRKTNMQFKTAGKTFGIKSRIIYNQNTRTSNIIESSLTKFKPIAKKAAQSSGPTLGMNIGLGTGLRTAGEVLGSPAAALAFATMTVKDNLEKGESLPAAVADKMVGLELLAPGAISRFAPGVMKGVLGLGRVARAFTPIGLGLTAAGAAKDVYREYKRREALSDEDRLQEDLEAQEKFDEMMVGAAKGGLIPPKSGKTPHGDKGLASLADYDMTNTEFINGRY